MLWKFEGRKSIEKKETKPNGVLLCFVFSYFFFFCRLLLYSLLSLEAKGRKIVEKEHDLFIKIDEAKLMWNEFLVSFLLFCLRCGSFISTENFPPFFFLSSTIPSNSKHQQTNFVGQTKWNSLSLYILRHFDFEPNRKWASKRTNKRTHAIEWPENPTVTSRIWFLFFRWFTFNSVRLFLYMYAMLLLWKAFINSIDNIFQNGFRWAARTRNEFSAERQCE